MKFTKMQGAGNDFIIIDNRTLNLPVETLCDIARTLCPRAMAVGADGLMAVVEPKAGGDFGMVLLTDLSAKCVETEQGASVNTAMKRGLQESL